MAGAEPEGTPGGRLIPRARWLLIGLAVAAGLVGALVVVIDTKSVSMTAVGILTVAIVAGEAFKIDLPFRRAGSARYGLGDVSLTAGLLVLSGTEVLVAATVAMVVSGFIDRPPLERRLFNITQYVLAAGVAAGVMEFVSPARGELALGVFGAAALAVLAFTFINVLSVSGGIALSSGASWVDGLRRIAPVAFLIAFGNAALGLIAVAVFMSYPWAVPAVAVPLMVMYSASRQEVRAKVDRERSDMYVAVEQALSETGNPEIVAAILLNGTRQLLGCNAAIWRDGRWVGEVPDGSGECPVDPGLAVPLVALGPGLGPATDGRCVAIGLGGGVLVVWEGESGLGPQTEEWLERLAQSGRAHFERAAAASALAQEQATLRAVVDGTRDGICVIDTDGVVRLWNPAMARMSGIPATQTLGKSAWQVLGEGPWTTEGVHDVIRDGGERVWRASVSGVRDDRHGSLKVAVFHDVTAERRVARMKDDMLAVVSHELRTPLTPIKASAQLLRRRWERMNTGDRNNLLERIEERSDHLARLVADILLVGQLSASDGPRLEVDYTEAELAALLHEVVGTQRSVHSTHDLALTAPDVVPATTDPVRVRQIVENLIDNACKYSRPGTRVDVTLSVGNGTATLRVADEGRGIPADDLERIFERFERVEDPLVMTTSGAGLGLYIVRELVTALGGEVDIASTLGRGTTVTLQLPLRPAEANPMDVHARAV